MKVFRKRTRVPFAPGAVLTIHQHGDTPSAQGSFVEVTNRFWVLAKHSIEAGGVFHESAHELVLVPTANVTLVEVTQR